MIWRVSSIYSRGLEKKASLENKGRLPQKQKLAICGSFKKGRRATPSARRTGRALALPRSGLAGLAGGQRPVRSTTTRPHRG